MYTDLRHRAPQREEEHQYAEQPRRLPIKLLLIGIPVLVVVLAVGWYLYSSVRPSGPQQTTAEEAQALVKKVERLMLLPKDEQPTVATVTDPAKLGDQPFFADAEPGDKVLIYAQSRKIILYSPSQNKIINVATLSMDGS